MTGCAMVVVKISLVALSFKLALKKIRKVVDVFSLTGLKSPN